MYGDFHPHVDSHCLLSLHVLDNINTLFGSDLNGRYVQVVDNFLNTLNISSRSSRQCKDSERSIESINKLDNVGVCVVPCGSVGFIDNNTDNLLWIQGSSLKIILNNLWCGEEDSLIPPNFRSILPHLI
ncbi:hypothetical protein WICPIJ_005110 [Wickerhamomyces pijperi]|uniref:Uncharacterized protein n=1 Tax=Wickerhamomyces pijperi TaxID=599730 RepID=A0A9P8Q6B2_WICPI|nr:hypothetical protein WICPIJ_005110 [Wickerhamomyces pijperi]